MGGLGDHEPHNHELRAAARDSRRCTLLGFVIKSLKLLPNKLNLLAVTKKQLVMKRKLLFKLELLANTGKLAIN